MVSRQNNRGKVYLMELFTIAYNKKVFNWNVFNISQMKQWNLAFTFSSIAGVLLKHHISSPANNLTSSSNFILTPYLPWYLFLGKILFLYVQVLI